MLNTFNEMFKEHYALQSLAGKEAAEAHLILRYWDKVPHKHARYKELIEIGNEIFNDILKAELNKESYLLKHMVKDDSWNQPVFIKIP